MKTSFLFCISIGSLFAALATFSCSDNANDCTKNLEPCGDGGTAQGAGGTTTQGGGGSTTTVGGGGQGGVGGGPDCLNHSHCTEPGAAKCDPASNECVPCDPDDPDVATQCAGIAGKAICDGGTCVECTLGDESACVAPQTCDLVAKECVDVAPGDVGNCGACTNDLQCATDHKCVPMDFPVGTNHGHFCLKQAMPTCQQPFSVFINEPSISGAPAVNYCGVDQNSTTCQAVRALQQGWTCVGDDGKCCSGSIEPTNSMCDSTQPEVDVPGALCRQVGALASRCTYECATALECPSGGPGATCNGNPAPTWCGG
jgi:hypothetical protein